jgi:hypothetical protein
MEDDRDDGQDDEYVNGERTHVEDHETQYPENKQEKTQT